MAMVLYQNSNCIKRWYFDMMITINQNLSEEN